MGLRIASVIGFPCSVGMSLLARPILFLCYGGSQYSAEQLMMAGSLLEISALTIILFTMVQATSGILQGVGKQHIPMLTLLAGVVCKIVLNLVLVRDPRINIHGAPIASLVCYTVSMVPNLVYVCKYTRTRFSVTDVVLRPLGASVLMGLAVWAVYTFAFGGNACLGGSTLLPVAVCILTGLAVYSLAAAAFGAIRAEDLPAKFRKALRFLPFRRERN